MTSFLSGSLAKTINKALKNVFLDATITRETIPAGGDPADPADPTTSTFTCKAIRDNYTINDKKGPNILGGDVKVLILAQSLATTPINGDLINIQGGIYRVVDVEIDPANALWIVQGR